MSYAYYCHVYHHYTEEAAVRAIVSGMGASYRRLPDPTPQTTSAHILYDEEQIKPITTALRVAGISLNLVSWGPMDEVEQFIRTEGLG